MRSTPSIPSAAKNVTEESRAAGIVSGALKPIGT